MAVTRATRRLKALSRRSSSSSGFGSSTSATRRRRALAHLLAQGVLAGLEGRHEALRLLLEQLPALVQPLTGAPLGLGGHLLRAPGELAAVLDQQLTRLLPRARRQQQRGRRPDHTAQEEPAQVPCRIVLLSGHQSSPCFPRSRCTHTSTPRRRPAASPTIWPTRARPDRPATTRPRPSATACTRSVTSPTRLTSSRSSCVSSRTSSVAPCTCAMSGRSSCSTMPSSASVRRRALRSARTADTRAAVRATAQAISTSWAHGCMGPNYHRKARRKSINPLTLGSLPTTFKP